MGLLRSDGRRPDGMSLIPWQDGKMVVWDVTVASTLAQSYADDAARGAGQVAERAAARKRDKYSDLTRSHLLLSLQRFNSVLFRDSFVLVDNEPE